MNKAIDDIRGQDSAELNVKLAELRKEQFELRFSGSGNEGQATGRARYPPHDRPHPNGPRGPRRQEASKAGEQN